MKRLLTSMLIGWMLLIGCSKDGSSVYIEDGSDGGETPSYYLEITPVNAQIQAGTHIHYQAFKVTGDKKQEVTGQVTWMSTNPTIATIDSTGTAVGLVTGDVSIQASLDDTSSSATLSVFDSVVSTLLVQPSQQVSLVGIDRQFYAYARFANGITQNITEDANWFSGNSGVAAVNQGLVNSLEQGYSAISASFMGANSKAELLVADAAPISLTIIPATATLPVGTSQNFIAQLLLDDGQVLDVTKQMRWQSNNATLFGVSNSSNSKGNGLALAVGTTEVVATASFAGKNLSQSAKVTITDATVTALTVNPASANIAAGTHGQLRAIATLSDGSSLNVSQDAVWQSSNTNVALVVTEGVNAGQGQALTPGATTVTALFKGFTASSQINVSSATLTALAIAPAQQTIAKGTQAQLLATGTYSDGSSADLTGLVSWSSANNTIATVAPNGEAFGVAAGNTSVYAEYQGLKATASIDVSSAVLTSIEIQPKLTSITIAEIANFSAVGHFSDGSTQPLDSVATWQTHNVAVAAVIGNGQVKGLQAGTAVVVARYNGIAGGALVLVAANEQYLEIDPALTQIDIGDTQILTAYVVDAKTGEKQDVTSDVTWSLSNPNIATLSGNQLTGVISGNSDLSATYGNLAAVGGVIVSPAALPTRYLEIMPLLSTIHQGTTLPYQAYLVNSKSRIDVTDNTNWQSSNNRLVTISSNGVATGKDAGTVNISAHYDNLIASTSLRVSAESLTKLSIVPPIQTSVVGLSRQFNALATYADGTSQDVTTLVSWNSSDPQISTISATGIAQSLAQGITTITANFLGSTATAKLIVANAVPVALDVNPDRVIMPVGKVQHFTAQLLLDNGDVLDVTTQLNWISTDINLMVVGNSRDTKGQAKALAQGDTQAVAGITLNGATIQADSQVTITSPTVTELEINPATASVPLGAQGQFKAVALYSDNTAQDVTLDAQWQSNNTDIVSVTPVGNNAGSAKALAVGNATIRASFEGLTANSNVSVNQASLQQLLLTPITTTTNAGREVNYLASGLYSDGSHVDLTDEVSWQSSDSNIAIPSNSGRVFTLAPGKVSISVALGALSDTASLTVTAASLTAIEVAPTEQDIVVGAFGNYRATGIYSDNSTQDLTHIAYWTTANESVATIDNLGRALAISTGSTTVTAQYQGINDTAQLTVTAPTLQQLLVLPENRTKPVGITQQFSTIGIFSDHIENLTQDVIWHTSDRQIAVVSNLPSSRGIATPLNTGSINVSTTFNDIEANTTLFVIESEVTSLTEVCDETTLSSNYQTQCHAIARYSNGDVQDVTEDARWLSSNSNIAKVNNQLDGTPGKVSAISSGITNITAQFRGMSASQAITVTEAKIASITVTAYYSTMVEKGNQQLTATANFSDGSSADITQSAFWSSTDIGVLTVSNDVENKGVVTAQAQGSTTISAEQDGMTGTSTVITVEAETIANVSKVQILCYGGTYSKPIDLQVGETDRCQAWAKGKDHSLTNVTAQTHWSVDKTNIAQLLGLTSDGQFMQIQGVSSGNTTLRAEYDKKAVIEVRVH